MKDVLSDGATVAGCCIGVGFLSGKEAQLFWGNFAGIGIFALCFFVANTVLRRFCYQKKLQKRCRPFARLLSKNGGCVSHAVSDLQFCVHSNHACRCAGLRSLFFPHTVAAVFRGCGGHFRTTSEKGIDCIESTQCAVAVACSSLPCCLGFHHKQHVSKSGNATFHADTICAVFHNDVAWRDCTDVAKQT